MRMDSLSPGFRRHGRWFPRSGGSMASILVDESVNS